MGHGIAVISALSLREQGLLSRGSRRGNGSARRHPRKLSLAWLPCDLSEHMDSKNDGMVALLVELQEHLRCRRHDRWEAEDTAQFSDIVSRIEEALHRPVPNHTGSEDEDAVVPSRESQFVELGGASMLAQVLPISVVNASTTTTDSGSTDGVAPLSAPVAEAITKCLQVLTDVCTADPQRTRFLSCSRGFMVSLFSYMRHPQLLEWSLGLMLAAGDELFPLTDVDGMEELVEGLSPKGLALFCRALAGIFSRNDEQPLPDGLPPQECIPPNLCTVCVNRALLLGISCLIPRVVRLLRLDAPPAWLCPVPHASNRVDAGTLYTPHPPCRPGTLTSWFPSSPRPPLSLHSKARNLRAKQTPNGDTDAHPCAKTHQIIGIHWSSPASNRTLRC